MAAATVAAKDKSILTKKNPMITGSSILAARQEKVKDAMMASSTSDVSDTKVVILEPPSFLKRTMEKIVEFILRNGKEFEGKLIEQDRKTGRFPFLLPSNPYLSYYLKLLEETQESKSRGGSSEHKDRRSSSEHKGSSHVKEETKSKTQSRTSKDASSSDRSSAEPSEKQLYDKCKQGKGKFHMIISGAKKEPPRNVTADEAAAIFMAATRGLGPANIRTNTPKDTSGLGQTGGDDGHTSSFGSFSSLHNPDVLSKPVSNSGAGTSLTSSGQPKNEGTGIIDDDWIANTISKAAAVAASKEADSSEASMTKEQKLKAERLRRAKMFASIIKSGGRKMADLSTSADPTNEAERASPGDLNLSESDPQLSSKEREGSSVPFEREGSNLTKQEKYSDDERNRARARKYRKKHHPESDEENCDSEESSRHIRKKHRSEHSRAHASDVYKHKHKRHSKDLEPRHHRHRHSSLEDEHEHRSSKSRHRHRDDYHYHEDDEHRNSHRHQRDHRSSSKRKKDYGRDKSKQTIDRPEVSQST